MNKREKGEYGYLGYKKKLNLTITLAFLAVIAIVFVLGLLIFKSRNNYMTLVATVLVLPWAKIAVGYIVLIPHKSCPKDVYDKLEKAKGQLISRYDMVIGNSKSPVGICAMAISDNTIIALSLDKNPDKTFFEKSLKEFLKNDKLNATVTLYTDSETFLKRAANLSANLDVKDENKMDRMSYLSQGTMNMCL